MSEAHVIIHVRFSNDGTVSEIGERPDGVTPQAWFDKLSLRSPTNYQILTGGRGVYRLTRSEIDEVKSTFIQQAQA